MKLNTEAYPDSFNAWDSLAEVEMDRGENPTYGHSELSQIKLRVDPKKQQRAKAIVRDCVPS